MKKKVVFRFGTYTHYLWIIKGSLLSELDIDDEVYKKLSLLGLKDLLENHILPDFDIDAEVTFEKGVVTAGTFFECKEVAVHSTVFTDDELLHED